jgi:1,4-dihydroxy-2-naphthoyl-CoA hydrolase
MTEASNRIWRPDVTLELLSERSRDTMMAHLGIELLELGDDFLSGGMTVDNRTCQPMKLLHGGASVVLAETLGSMAANSVIDVQRFACVGQEINANHLRPVPFGRKVIGTTRPFHIGARTHVWGIEIHDDRKQLVCVSRITMAVINR